MLPLMNLWNTVWLPRSDDRRLMDTVRYSGGLELNVLVKLKNMDLEKLDQILNDDLNFKQLPKQPLFVRMLERLCAWPSTRDHVYGEIPQLDN